MFHAAQRLPHLLPPHAYSSELQHSWEMSYVYANSWHFVGLTAELKNPGDFMTTEVCGRPIQVRNIDGVIHAVSNVCAHRHCLLSSLPRGNSPKLRCQYHGWEYAASGQTNRIPEAHQFAPLDRSSTSIPVYQVETVGQLVFVNLAAQPTDLKTCLGPSLAAIERGFGSGWEMMIHREIDQPVNWKVPVENSLEAYHVPAVHPDTFKEDPGEARSEHFLGPYGSSFQTTLPFAPHSKSDEWFQKVEGRVLKTLIGGKPTCIYQHHHIFPNILCSFTDMVSVLQIVRPVSPRACRMSVFQFGRVGKSSLSKSLCRLWGQQAARITMAILQEDFRLYPDIQRGLDASQNPGMLGRSEERIHHFQHWLQSRTTGKETELGDTVQEDPGRNCSNDCQPATLQ